MYGEHDHLDIARVIHGLCRKVCSNVYFSFDVNRKVSPTDGAIPFAWYMAQGQEAEQSSSSGKFSQ